MLCLRSRPLSLFEQVLIGLVVLLVLFDVWLSLNSQGVLCRAYIEDVVRSEFNLTGEYQSGSYGNGVLVGKYWIVRDGSVNGSNLVRGGS